jgi:hypothetical protein
MTVVVPSALSVAPVPVVPRIEVGADHHDLVAQRRVGARQFGQHVVRVAPLVVVELRLDVDAQLHRHLLLQEPRDHVVLLAAQRDRRHGPRPAVAAGDEHGAVLADARPEDDADAALPEDAEPALRRRFPCRCRRHRGASHRRGVRRGVGHVGRIARLRTVLAHEGRHHRLGHRDGALQLPAHRLDLVGRLARR